MFDTRLFEGKHFLVTGGGTGLGRTISERFAELGASVTIWGRRPGILADAAEEIADRTGATIWHDPVDIRDPQMVETAVEKCFEQTPLDGLVNNAAGNFISPTERLSSRGFDAIAAIVFHGTFYVTHACAKKWLAEQRQASVLSILTTWVWGGSPFVVPSAMSKAGIGAMTQSLAVEWGPKGLRFNAIAPGPFPTKGAWDRLAPGSDISDGDIKDSLKTNPMRRVGEHNELANLAAFLMSDRVSYINGAIVPIDGGQYLNNAGTFSNLWDVTDEQWTHMRDAIKQANARDKADRING